MLPARWSRYLAIGIWHDPESYIAVIAYVSSDSDSRKGSGVGTRVAYKGEWCKLVGR